MKGLELAARYYEACGKEMLEKRFPELLPKIAIGLAGAGSEVLGYDDELSQDHDFEPGFCIFLPSEDVVTRREAFLLERAYSALPEDFEGFRRNRLNPVGGNRHGVIRLADFLEEHLGNADGKLGVYEWLRLPEQYLLEVTGGRIFRDDSGFFTEIREQLSFFPEDLVKKKLAGNLLYAAQAGQYNYERCLQHGEEGAAQLALYDFVKAAMHCFFLLSGRYMPYYKWRFRAFSELPSYAKYQKDLELLITKGNRPEQLPVKRAIISKLLSAILEDAGADTLDPGKAAYQLNDQIRDSGLRNLDILTGVQD